MSPVLTVALATILLLPADRAFGVWRTYRADEGGLAGNWVGSILEDHSEALWFTTWGSGVSRFDGIAWTTYTVEDSLASNNVWASLEDSAGNLWFGTTAGLSVFNGTAWSRYRLPDVPPGGDYVVAILEDHSNNLWFGTCEWGVTRFDGDSLWTTYTTSTSGLATNKVWAICEDRSGALWFATYGGGVSRFHEGKWTPYSTATCDLASNDVLAIFEDRSGSLWFATWGGGASRLHEDTWTTYTTTDGLASNYVSAILQDEQGILWFGTQGGVSRFNGLSWRSYTIADGLADNDVGSMMEDSSGNIWFATQRGVSCFDRAGWRTYRDGFAAFAGIGAMLEDRSGKLWFAYDTEGTGVTSFDGASWENFTIPEGPAGAVGSMLETPSGDLWFGSYSHGVSRFSREVWTNYSVSDEMASDSVAAILLDPAGDLWVQHWTRGDSVGVSRRREHDGSWTTYTTANGLAGNYVMGMMNDGSGRLWFRFRWGHHSYDPPGVGVSCLDLERETWTRYTTLQGLPSNNVTSFLASRSGAIWFGTSDHGVSQLDDGGWEYYSVVEGLADSSVWAIFEDRSETLWFSTGRGISRFRDGSWTTYTIADGLVDSVMWPLLQDRWGDIWFRGNGGVSRFDGESWSSYRSADGLGHDRVQAMLEDGFGDLWFGTAWGATVRQPDHVPPQTVILAAPPALSGNASPVIGYLAAFGDNGVTGFSYSLDGAPWSDWTSGNLWTGVGLPDGPHSFSVRATDIDGNVDQTPALVHFEIDATAPLPVLSYPTSGGVLRDSVAVTGTAADLRFGRYRLELRPAGAMTWEPPVGILLMSSTQPVTEGTLGTWDTKGVPDGVYEIRLSVADTLGLTGSALVRVTVDNTWPFVEQTAPVLVTSGVGGDVYTATGDLHLYFPPHAFPRDVTVAIRTLDPAELPDTLPGGAVLAGGGYEFSWGDVSLAKPATLSLALTALSGGRLSPDSGSSLAFYVSETGPTWWRLGGTEDKETGSLAVPISGPGRYAVYEDVGEAAGEAGISSISMTPRVFSPTGGFADSQVAISFSLGRSAPVTVKVYNRAGRLVREVLREVPLGAGVNLVRWDGRDAEDRIVEDGLYLVTIEAQGLRETKTLAVVR